MPRRTDLERAAQSLHTHKGKYLAGQHGLCHAALPFSLPRGNPRVLVLFSFPDGTLGNLDLPPTAAVHLIGRTMVFFPNAPAIAGGG